MCECFGAMEGWFYRIVDDYVKYGGVNSYKKISTGWNIYFMDRCLNTDKINAEAKVRLINIQGFLIVNTAYLQL